MQCAFYGMKRKEIREKRKEKTPLSGKFHASIERGFS
jgi:hypothetical protein